MTDGPTDMGDGERAARWREVPAFAAERLVRLLDADPGLARGIAPGQLSTARAQVVAPLLRLQPGVWPARTDDLPQGFALLVLDGLLVRELRIGRRPAAQFVGPGDVLPSGSPTVEGIACNVADRTAVAVLDERFLAASRRWPSLAARMVERGARWADRALLLQAIASLPRVEERITALFADLAGRWGEPAPTGVEVPLALKHATIGRLVGAERPTVSLALKALADAGHLRRTDGGWVLTRDQAQRPPEGGRRA